MTQTERKVVPSLAYSVNTLLYKYECKSITAIVTDSITISYSFIFFYVYIYN